MMMTGAVLALAACGGGDARGGADSLGIVSTDSLRQVSQGAVAAGSATIDSLQRSGQGAAAGLSTAARGAVAGTADDPSLAGAAGNMSAENMMAMIGISNRNEIRSSELARTRATDPQVREFANAMVRDHQAMQTRADALKLDADEPPRADAMKRMGDSLVTTLQGLQGRDFDLAYMQGQVLAHQRTLRELETYNDMAVRADVRTLVDQAAPQVRAHLERARALETRLVGAGGAGAAPAGGARPSGSR
jgi:putative membrane protein